MRTPDAEQACAIPAPASAAVGDAGREAPIGFDAMYRDHAAFVWRTLRRYGVAAEQLEDATQSVFLVVHRKLDSFEARSSVRTWLFRIATRVAKDFRRSATRKGFSQSLDMDTLADVAHAPDDGAARREAATTVEAVLAELGADRRAVFVLAELEEMSVPEIAAALGWNPNTTASRLRDARRDFEAALRRRQSRTP